jgi:hypothetical protein
MSMSRPLLRSFGFGLLLGAGLLFLHALAYSVLPRCQDRLEEESESPVVDGLRLRVVSLERQGKAVRMTFALERVGNADWVLMRPLGVIDLSFWDAAGRKVGKDSALFQVSVDFAIARGRPPSGPFEWSAYLLCRTPDEAHDTTEFVPPPGASSVSFSYGGVSTRPVPLPR